MELSAELFDQVVAGLGGPAPAPSVSAAAGTPPKPADERRRIARLTVATDVMVTPFGVAVSNPRPVRIQSLSRTGAAILDQRTMQTGDKIVLHLPRPDLTLVPIACEVRNSRLSGSGFRIGVEFLSHVEHTGAPAMLRGADGVVQRQAGPGQHSVIDDIAEGRAVARGGRDSRVEVNVAAMASRYVDGRTHDMWAVTIKDISPGGGVCVIQPDEMKRGEQFVLQIPRRRGKPLMMLCTVVDCRVVKDGTCRVGARFVTRLSAEDKPPPSLLGRVYRWFAA